MDPCPVSVIEEIQTLEAAAWSVTGWNRTFNEDAVFAQTNRLSLGYEVGLFMVCDGFGGGQAGDVASQLAIQTIADELAKVLPWVVQSTHVEPDSTIPNGRALRYWTEQAIIKANRVIRDYSDHHPEIEKAGSTLALVLIYQGIAYIANIGDSRVYSWRNGRLVQLTNDQSLVGALVRKGVLTLEQARSHPLNSVILQALGIQDNLEIDFYTHVLIPGERLLLCTDGCWFAYESQALLAEKMGTELPAGELCASLVNAANILDGSDNISAVVVYA